MRAHPDRRPALLPSLLFRPFAGPLSGLLLLAGCATVPPPSPVAMQAEALPNMRLPGSFRAGLVPDAKIADGWLASFKDPALEALVAEALAYNSDLAIAATRVERANAYLTAASGALLPSVGLAGLWSGSAAPSGGGLNALFLNANVELDLWGRLRYGAAAARSGVAAAQADAAFARQSLAAMVARGWFMAIAARQQRELAREALVRAERLVVLAQQRLRVGVGNEADVADARAAAAGYAERARQAEAALEQSIRALEQLLGRYPATRLELAPGLPDFPPPVPVGLPSELMERRPDVVAARERVAVAFNLVGEARAARLPRIRLTAGLSTISSDLLVLLDRNNPAFGFGADLIAPLFQGNALVAQVAIRSAEQDAATAAWAGTALNAFREVEDALGAEFALADRSVLLAEGLRQAARALELAEIQYRVGSGDLRGVEQRQLALYAARSSLLQVEMERRAQRVNLHLVLGGSFESAATATADRS